MTKLLYVQDPDLLKSTSIIILRGTDDRGDFIVLDQTPFYPQGGGQPADQGEICCNDTCSKIYDVRMVDGRVRHYIDAMSQTLKENTKVSVQVDPERRKINMRCHTAGHLLADVVEMLIPNLKATKGHQFPGQSYIEFDGIIEPEKKEEYLDVLQKKLNDEISRSLVVQIDDLKPEEIGDDFPYELPKGKKLRACRIEGYPAVPCGGTHVKQLAEIGEITIKSIKSKKGRTKISYLLPDVQDAGE